MSVFLERRHAELRAERDQLRLRVEQLECALQIATVDSGDLLFRLAGLLDACGSKSQEVTDALAEAERCGWERT